MKLVTLYIAVTLLIVFVVKVDSRRHPIHTAPPRRQRVPVRHQRPGKPAQPQQHQQPPHPAPVHQPPKENPAQAPKPVAREETASQRGTQQNNVGNHRRNNHLRHREQDQRTGSTQTVSSSTAEASGSHSSEPGSGNGSASGHGNGDGAGEKEPPTGGLLHRENICKNFSLWVMQIGVKVCMSQLYRLRANSPKRSKKTKTKRTGSQDSGSGSAVEKYDIHYESIVFQVKTWIKMNRWFILNTLALPVVKLYQKSLAINADDEKLLEMIINALPYNTENGHKVRIVWTQGPSPMSPGTLVLTNNDGSTASFAVTKEKWVKLTTLVADQAGIVKMKP